MNLKNADDGPLFVGSYIGGGCTAFVFIPPWEVARQGVSGPIVSTTCETRGGENTVKKSKKKGKC